MLPNPFGKSNTVY